MQDNGKTIIAAGGTFNIGDTDNTNHDMYLGRELDNYGTTNWLGSYNSVPSRSYHSSLDFTNGTINNYGTLTANNVGYAEMRAVSTGAGQSNQFNNTQGATFTKTGATPVVFDNAPSVVDFTNSGTVSVQMGALQLNPLTNNGAIALYPGGRLNIAGDFAQPALGSLSVTAASATSFGLLAITGNATLDGTLNVYESDNYVPAVGDVLKFLTCASRTGTFPTVNGLSIALSAAQMNSTITLAGGAINGGVWSGSGSIVATARGAQPYNMLAGGVEVDCALDLTASSASVHVTGGLTLNGTATLGYNAWVFFDGSQTLGGNGKVVFTNNNTQGLVANVISGSGATSSMLTIGAGITLHGGGAGTLLGYSAVLGSSTGAGASNATDASVVLLGTVSADTSGMNIIINPKGAGTFTNNGTISASNGGTLYVYGTTGNLGTATLGWRSSQLAVVSCAHAIPASIATRWPASCTDCRRCRCTGTGVREQSRPQGGAAAQGEWRHQVRRPAESYAGGRSATQLHIAGGGDVGTEAEVANVRMAQRRSPCQFLC